jgi:MFS family permease
LILAFCGFIFFAQEPWLIYLWGFLFGVQNSVYAVSTPLLIRQTFGEKDYTKIFTWARIGTGAIGFLGPMLFGFLVDWRGDFTLCFVFGILIAILSFVCVIWAERTKKKLVWEEAEKST